MDKTLIHGGLLILVILSALFSMILGVILAYHWEKFSMNSFVSRAAILIYTGVTLVLITTLVALLPA